MKMTYLLVFLLSLSTTSYAAEETINLTLLEIHKDATVLQRRVAVFQSNEKEPRTFYLRVSPTAEPKPKEKNGKNLVTLISRFPVKAPKAWGLKQTFKPRGTLSFRTPKKDPVKNIDEWEVMDFQIEEETEQSDGEATSKTAPSAVPEASHP
jgi:hypothetical protein